MSRRRRWRLLLAWLAASGGIAAACHNDPPAEVPHMLVERRACLADPPPPKPALVVAGPAQGCPDAFLACMARDEYLKLKAWETELKHWARKAWTKCGPLPANQPPADAGTGGR